MSTATYTPISTVTLTAETAFVSFSNLPQNFSDLVVVVSAGTSQSSAIFLEFNNRDTSNFITARLSADGNTVTGQVVGQFLPRHRINFLTPTTGLVGETSHVMNIFNYTSAASHKLILIRGDAGNAGTEIVTGRWSLFFVPVTSLTISTDSTQLFLPGSTFSLYGIIA